MLKDINGQLVPFCDCCGAILPVKNYAGKCHRCGHPRPFLIFDAQGRVAQEEHTEVSLAMNVNIIHGNGCLDVRLPRYHFQQCAQTESGETSDVVAVRNLLKGHGVKFTESGGAVIDFRIPEDEGQQIATWVNGLGHGFRIVMGKTECELEVRGNEILTSTNRNVQQAIALASLFS